jgi:hypothetical protein
MSSSLNRRIASALFLFLALQLTGLTCIQDLWAYSDPSNPGSLNLAAVNSTDNPSGSSSSQPAVHHDCPCHHLITNLFGFSPNSTHYNGEFNLDLSTPVPDSMPRSIFHPPFFLL